MEKRGWAKFDYRLPGQNGLWKITPKQKLICDVTHSRNRNVLGLICLGMERVMTPTQKMTRFDSTRRTRVESSQYIWHDLKMNSTFSSTFCYWAKWNLVRMLIYNAIATDKRKISLQSPFLALTHKSRVRALTRLK